MAIIDITDHVVDYLKSTFVGKRVSENGLEIDKSVNSLGVGDRTNASGSMTISSFQSHDGKIEKAPMFDGYGYRAELNVVYGFDAQTSAENTPSPVEF
ncbi:hypothetical protein ACFVQB_14395 [Paenibacillus sp. NPDC057886]|uniref:hypothetical protein n=1 Tax=Paenibacillus sp. NPDC057886 TaxID=3346270 RepID=UPI0036B5BFAA